MMRPDPVTLKYVVHASGTVKERKKLENQSFKSLRQVDNHLYGNITYLKCR